MVPIFSIGTVPIYGYASLAPMDGISDQPFRLICKQLGSSFTISEFINSADVPDKLKDYSARTSFTNYERPFGYQIYGEDIHTICTAAKLLEKRHPDFIDLNLGCSVRRVAGRGAGAGLLRSPEKVRDLIRNLKNAMNIPLTVKIRLGWDLNHLNYLEIAKIAEGEGAAMLAVHARRRDQSFRVPANWEAIHQIKQHIKIPVIGNGDIQTQEDIHRMIEQTGCDGVMIGRAALGNPWIFSGANKRDLTPTQIWDVVIKHFSLMLACFDPEMAVMRFKKHLKAYLSCEKFAELDLSELLRSDNPFVFLFKKYPQFAVF